jgi:hypothetical protein
VFGQLPGWKSDTTGKGPHGTHISGKHGLADCQFVTSLLYSSGFFLLLLKNNSFEQWPSISDYMIYFIFFIILEDWIYFRDNKIVRWFHKKNLHQILQTFRYFPNVFDGKSQYLLQSRLLSIKLINFFLLQYNSLHRMLLFLSVRYKS